MVKRIYPFSRFFPNFFLGGPFFVFLVFICCGIVSLSAIASEHAEKKEEAPQEEKSEEKSKEKSKEEAKSEPAKEGHGGEASKEADGHGKAEKPSKADKEEVQERLQHPNRIRIQDLSVSRFGPNDKVVALVTYHIYIIFQENEQADKANKIWPRLRSEVSAKLTDFLSKDIKIVHNAPSVRRIIRKAVEKVMGAKCVKQIDIFKSFERKL